jgi:hypothetical protein
MARLSLDTMMVVESDISPNTCFLAMVVASLREEVLFFFLPGAVQVHWCVDRERRIYHNGSIP